ncbi:hypothetical protein EJ06DRAFT_226908 [Trichodelitschia bisporula]|uniref:Uncharacterized protein n=1 Tax=Trichodelitschia bisporula TaxID=703511 RepID=A0A6G1HKU1_9PEZI|nr:hypothetical protein EJ06DRAFT_226908 [Trichodelitschia bisporula]
MFATYPVHRMPAVIGASRFFWRLLALGRLYGQLNLIFLPFKLPFIFFVYITKFFVHIAEFLFHLAPSWVIALIALYFQAVEVFRLDLVVSYVSWTYLFLVDDEAFYQDYTKAWEDKFAAITPVSEPCSLLLFRDSMDGIEVPCSINMADDALLRHISSFYYLGKAKRGLLEALGMRSLAYIEVTEVHFSFSLKWHR